MKELNQNSKIKEVVAKDSKELIAKLTTTKNAEVVKIYNQPSKGIFKFLFKDKKK